CFMFRFTPLIVILIHHRTGSAARRASRRFQIPETRSAFHPHAQRTLSVAAMAVSRSERSFLGKRELPHRSADSMETISRAALRARSVEVPIRAHDHTTGISKNQSLRSSA